jgi:hypothetical protein
MPSHPVLSMDGYQWDISNLSGETSASRKAAISSVSAPDINSIKAPPGTLSSVSSYLSEKASSYEEAWSKDNRSNDSDAKFHPSIFWMMQANNSVGEYDVIPNYPHISEIPACLDVDDIFDKIRVSTTASKEGGGIHRVERLSPPRYLRSSRPDHPTAISSSRLPPSSPRRDHRQFGDGSSKGSYEGGKMVSQSEPMSRLLGSGEPPLHSRSDEDYYYNRRHLNTRTNIDCRPERPSVASRSRQEDSQSFRQHHTRRVHESDFPTVEVVVPTFNESSRRSRIPQAAYRQDQQRRSGDSFRMDDSHGDNSRYTSYAGDEHYHSHTHRRQLHNQYEVHYHPRDVEDSSYSRQSRSSASFVSGISEDRQASSYGQQQQLEQQYSAVDDRLVEVTPGTYVKLRGSVETWHAIQTGRTTRTACLSCTVMLLCIQDADMIMCPACRSISPVDRDNFGGGGLGLGMAETEARMELDRLASMRR